MIPTHLYKPIHEDYELPCTPTGRTRQQLYGEMSEILVDKEGALELDLALGNRFCWVLTERLVALPE